jgi:eukaryotic-like serine/threonine-protein kinase
LLSQKGLSDTLKGLLTLALLAVAFLIGAGAITYLAVRGRHVAVPNVVGKSKEEARKEFDEAGLRMAVKSAAYDDKAPAGDVIDQLPAAGMIIKTGQIVRISLSLGAQPRQNAQK